MIQLTSRTERAHLVDPAGNRVEQVIEHRQDPLTGAVATINAALGEKAKAFLGAADVGLLAELEASTRPTCPFCNAGEKGTRFPPELVPGGQLRVGSAVAIPNLFAKAGFDAVVIVDPSLHVMFPSRIAAAALADAFQASAELVRRARAHDAALVHHVAGMNFLGPGGSSVPHPHLQVHVRGVPYAALTRATGLAAAFLDRTGRGYFEALLDLERGGPRHVGTTGDVEWLAAWAPAHQKELWGVLPGVASLADLDARGAEAFAAGVSRIVSFYEESGTHPFTFAFHSSPDGAAARGWALHVKVCSRPAFRPQYVNYDTWFTPKFLGDDVHTEAPEAYAARLRSRW
jgi:UDPglucose--hexose-1-phosphate uridylyltransferase